MSNYTITISAHARAIILEILASTEERFGQKIRLDYKQLISQALHDLGERPQDARSHEEIFPGCHLYHIKWSLKRMRFKHNIQLKSARHFFVCESINNKTIHIVDIIYDGMDLPRRIVERLEISDDDESTL